jgi:hypothetical protein
MNRKRLSRWLGVFGLVGSALWLMSLSSCARSQQLTGITISPSAFTYFAPAAPGSSPNPIPLTAYGTFIHPPETKDITSQVTWASNQTLVANVSSSGVLTAGTACGTADISATYYTDGNPSGNLMVGFMTVTVEGPASEGCPTGTATQSLSIDVTNGTDGTIVSSPAGINCGLTCSATFATGSSVALTATPGNGFTFGGWGPGCTSVQGTTCNVVVNTNITLTAAFN